MLLPDALPTAVTCAGCGCGCDDIELGTQAGRIVRLIGACPLGATWFTERMVVSTPPARVDGAEVDLGTAIDTAASILSKARAPLVYGLGQAACEAQRRAVAIAEAVGGVIDLASGVLDGQTAVAFQAAGASTATLGEIRDRAEVVVIWRADPARTHPRLLKRLRLDPLGRAQARQRILVVVDSERTATAREADLFVELPRTLDVEALWVLRGLVRRMDLAPADSSELPWALLGQLSERLLGAGHVAFLHDGGLSAGAGPIPALALNALVRDLSQSVHAVSATLRREGNASGAEAVLTWQTGYPAAVSFARGYPRANGDEFSAPALLEGGEVDAVLVLASDPLEHLPAAAAAALRTTPTITIDARDTMTAQTARVAILTGAAGIHQQGTAHRLDDVPVPLRSPLSHARPRQEDVLRRLGRRLRRPPTSTVREATAGAAA